jgi:hypothetical protein
LIDERRQAITYDWHARFGQPVAAIGSTSMPWAEAVALAQVIHVDPSSMLSAAALGWDYPLTREALISLDTFDLLHAANTSKRPKPHPMRPKTQTKRSNRYGNTGGRSVDEVKAILAANRGAVV